MININMLIIISASLSIISCSKSNEATISTDTTEIEETSGTTEYKQLPLRPGDRPATTDGVPHHQLNLDHVQDVDDEMVRRVFSVSGIDNEPSVILSWKGLWLNSNIQIENPQALISGREFGHIHDDGSLHIFLEPSRAIEAIESGWAVYHPYAVEGKNGWDGFVLLYTPQTMEELNVVFQLIIDSFNYVTGQQVDPKDFY